MPLRPQRRSASHAYAAALSCAAPFVLGAVAVAIWLRRRQVERRALPPPRPEPARPRTGRFDRPPSGRFTRDKVDIVTVVDDLLRA
jgi:hypothetical protein